MTVLQEPVQVKTHVQFVVMSGESSIYEARAAFSVPASAAGSVRGVSSPPPRQRPHSPLIAARDVLLVLLMLKPQFSQCGLVCQPSFGSVTVTQC